MLVDRVASPEPLARLPEDWEAVLAEWGEPRYRGRQLFRWIHQRGVFDPTQMTDLPRSLRDRLPEASPNFEGTAAAPAVFAPPFEIVRSHRSPDATEKVVLRLHDGRDIETVLIPQLRDRDPDREDEPAEVAPGRVPGSRVTQCISSQVGCAMGCVFCASGLAGLKRSLTAAEIVGQVLLGRSRLGDGAQLRNVVFMGMGEPLHNYDAVARTLRLLSHPDGLALSTRRVTVSTSGLVPEIDRLGADFRGQVQLAISLHAVDDQRRSDLMPINRRYPLRELMAALRRYPLPRRRRITIEYTLIRGVNDGDAEARALARLLKGIPVKVNLIPMNPVAESSLLAPGNRAVQRFQERLSRCHIACFVRTQRGDEIAAACGQLALQRPDGTREKPKVRRLVVR